MEIHDAGNMVATMPNPAHAIPEHRLICRVCAKQYSKYTCPRCNMRYCSLPCYKKHSLRCTESFMRSNVIEEMRDLQSTKQSQQKMLEVLQRVRIDEDGRSIFEDESLSDKGVEDDDLDDVQGTVFSDKTLKLIAEGGDISLDDLSIEERKGFLRALAAGEISHLIQPWNPWWFNPRAGIISITEHGTSLIQLAFPSEEQSTKQATVEALKDAPSEVPAPPSERLAQISHLIRGEPSPSISVQLAEVIYSYCFTLRFCNGDWESEPLEAVSILLSASQVLDQAASPDSIQMALADAVKTVCSPTFKHAGGITFAVALFDDCSAVLRLGRACAVCALADLHRLLESAKRELKAELIAENRVRLRIERRNKFGDSDENSNSNRKSKENLDFDANQKSNCRVVSEQGSEETSFAALRKARDSKRGLNGKMKPGRTDTGKPTTISYVHESSRRASASEGRPKQGKSSLELKKITAAIRKIYFLMCWTNEQPTEVFLSLASLVDTEKNTLVQTEGTINTGLGMTQDVKMPVTRSGPIIEEIVDQ